MYIPKVYLRHYTLRQNIDVKKKFSDKIHVIYAWVGAPRKLT